MRNALVKNLYREIKKTMSRFLSIFAIVALGVAFFAGVKATSPNMKQVGDQYLDQNNITDISILSTTGFGEMDIKEIEEISGVEKVVGSYNIDALAKKDKKEIAVKIHSLPNEYEEDDINQSILLEGRLPLKQNECVVESAMLTILDLGIGDSIQVKTSNGTMKFKITGTIVSPLYLEKHNRGSNSLGNGETQAYMRVKERAAVELATPKGERIPGITLSQIYTELLVKVKNVESLNTFDKEYEDLVARVVTEIEDLGEEKEPTEWFVLDRNKNFSFVGFSNDILRIKAIGSVFPILFFLVAALISLTTMTRMVEEQRTQIGTLKALGYGKIQILFQYFIYSFSASIGGSIVGLLIGFRLFPTLIFKAYQILYEMPNIEPSFQPDLALTSIIVAVVCTTSAAMIACMGELLAVPAVLMRPKAPKVGKRILLERVGFIWNNMVFTRKVTARNLLRYKKRFFMSVIGIAGCTALLLTGYGLKNSIVEMSVRQFGTVFTNDIDGYLKETMGEGEARYFAKDLCTYENISRATMVYEQNTDIKKVDSDQNTIEAYVVVPQSNSEIERYIHLNDKGEALTIQDESVIITEKFARLLDVNVGEYIEIEMDEKKIKAKVGAITENYMMHYVYMSKTYYETLMKEPVMYNKFMGMFFDKQMDNKEQLGKELMKNPKINGINFIENTEKEMKEMLKSIDYVVVVMIISAAALAFIVMYNLTNININERIRELATIKVLGFYDEELAMYVYRENGILSIIGTGMGLLLGVITHAFVLKAAEVDMIMFVKEINLASYVYSSLLTLAFAGIVNLVMYKKIKEINMVESLKTIE